MTPATVNLIIAWIIYGAVHSLLASMRVKSWVADRWPGAIPGYRLSYNLIALIGLAPVGYLHFAADQSVLWAWHGWAAWIANGLAFCAFAAFLVSTRYYDGAEFFGFRQLRERHSNVQDSEGFKVSPFHRFVRHPWYSFALVILWTRDMSQALLVSVVMISLYFWLGSRLEERKLISLYGTIYERYREHVPGLIPLPWRYLSEAEADKLRD